MTFARTAAHAATRTATATAATVAATVTATVVATAGLMGAAPAAQAATVTFDLGCGGAVACDSANPARWTDLPGALTLTSGGLTGTFSAKAFAKVNTISPMGNEMITGATVRDGTLGRYQGGAGVFSSAKDSHTLDGSGMIEFIQFSFSSAVALTGLSFGYYDTDLQKDWFQVISDTTLDGSIGNGDVYGQETKIAGANPATGLDYFGDTFGVMAPLAYDSYKLSSVTVDYTPPAAVPLPAGGLLLASALAGGIALRRRRRAG